MNFYGSQAFITALTILGYIALVYRFTRRDKLPDKLPDCVWHTTAKLIRVYDGDTFFAVVKGHSPIGNKVVGIRLRGIDTPEMNGSSKVAAGLAQKAKAIAECELKTARVINLYNVNTSDKYGRILATVFCDTRDLAKILLEKKLAKKYNGGKKECWK